LTGLPEKIRKTLERLVSDLRIKENVYGISLFGSWSRNDATTASDVDLIIIDAGDLKSEFVERMETNGLLIDLDHVPKRWLSRSIPPEIDQKLYEMQILYDRDWSLHNTKLLMAKSYVSPERVDIRTESHIVDSDIYLSRATSASSREDFLSAHLFSIVALESILKVLVEIALEPFSNSRFLEKLEVSTAKLGMRDLYGKYLEVSRLNKADIASAKEKLKLFRLIWDEMKIIITNNPHALEFSHFKVKTKLNYYLNLAFLQGVVMRTNFLIESGKAADASHYLQGIFLDMAENYIWLKSQIDKVKTDYTTMMRSLKRLEEKSPKTYGYMVQFLGLEDITKLNASKAVENAREVILKIRGERKILIKNFLLG
jgi:predicted nucleotidyltransferase